MEGERIYKFSGTVFKNVIARLEETMGAGTIRAVFRLVGRDLGRKAAERIKKKHKISSCSLGEYAKILVEEVIAPVTGNDGVTLKESPDNVEIDITVCPFERMGFDISNKFYCTYTESLIGRVVEEKFGKEAIIKINSLKSAGHDKCSFQILK
ncbi:MAG: methanogen output domain 1-containing protein [Candidatus Jordarchaeaceae archaeon]